MSPDFPARIGPYDVIGVIGSGRLGTVYRAFHEAQSRVVIIRVLSPALLADARRLEQFRHNTQALAAIGNRNLTRTSDAGQEGDLVYTVTEYVDGCSLHDRLETSRLTLAEAIHVVREVAGGLRAAHGAHVVHGDLNPRNILVSRDLSVVKVADFGTGDLEHQEHMDATVALARARIGSLLYRAPELVRDGGVADERCDVYSLGVIAYEAMTGKLPVGRFSLPSDANKQVPLELDPIVLKCLAADPAQRYLSAAAFVADLDKVEQVVDYQLIAELKRLSGGRLFTRKDGPATGAKGPSRTPLYVGVAAVLVIAGAVTTAMLLRGHVTTPTETNAPAARPPATVEAPVTPAPPDRVAAAVAPPVPTTVQPTPVTPAPATQAPATRAPATLGPPAVATQPNAAVAALVPSRKERPPVVPPARPTTSAVPATPAEGRPGADATPVKPDSEKVAEALFNEAQALLKANRAADARARLASIGQLHATSSWFVPAMTVKCSIEDSLHLREFDAIVGAVAPASMATRRLLAAGAPQNPAAEAALWRLGEMYEDIKQYPLAAAAYVQLGTRFPNTRYDAWFKAAEINERRVKNTAEAVRAYLRVPASSSRYRDAQERARKLGGRLSSQK